MMYYCMRPNNTSLAKLPALTVLPVNSLVSRNKMDGFETEICHLFKNLDT
jgi:hypothetical protein